MKNLLDEIMEKRDTPTGVPGVTGVTNSVISRNYYKKSDTARVTPLYPWCDTLYLEGKIQQFKQLFNRIKKDQYKLSQNQLSDLFDECEKIYNQIPPKFRQELLEGKEFRFQVDESIKEIPFDQAHFLDPAKKPKCLHRTICRYSTTRLDEDIHIPILWCSHSDTPVFDHYRNQKRCPLSKWERLNG